MNSVQITYDLAALITESAGRYTHATECVEGHGVSPTLLLDIVGEVCQSHGVPT